MKRSKKVIAALTMATIFASVFFDASWMLDVSAQTGVGYLDDRYGTNGLRFPIWEEKVGPDGRKVTENVGNQWRDSRGRVMEEERIVPGENGEETITTEYYNPGPNTKNGEKGTLARRVKRRIRRPLAGGSMEELLVEEQWFAADGKTQIRGSKRETGANGRKRHYRWEPSSGGYIDITDNAAGFGKTSAKSGYAVAAEAVSGLDTTVFSTPKGKIRVNLPDDMSAGDTLSGTVSAEPTGKNEQEQAQNDGELNGMVIEVEKEKTSTASMACGSLKLTLPVAIATTYILLRDKKGAEVARREIPVLAQPPPTEAQFDLPTAGQLGRSLEIRGPFDGDTGTTQISIGVGEITVLAESPRAVIARNPTGQTVGPSEMQVREKDRVVTGPFRTLGLQLSAPKLDLRTGEQTTVAIKVTGLEGLKTAIPLDLENRSAGVIQMGGGNSQRITISPAMAEAGTYVTERPLTGIQRGAFTIAATVVADRQRPDAVLASGGPLISKATDTKGYEICGAGCTNPPAVQQGTGKIRCLSSNVCKNRGTNCDCHLFSRAVGSKDDLDHAADPGVWTPRLVLDYVCRCVKKK